MIKAFHYFHAVVGTANSELGCFFARFTAAVDGNQEVMAAAFHVNVISQSSRITIDGH